MVGAVHHLIGIKIPHQLLDGLQKTVVWAFLVSRGWVLRMLQVFADSRKPMTVPLVYIELSGTVCILTLWTKIVMHDDTLLLIKAAKTKFQNMWYFFSLVRLGWSTPCLLRLIFSHINLKFVNPFCGSIPQRNMSDKTISTGLCSKMRKADILNRALNQEWTDFCMFLLPIVWWNPACLICKVMVIIKSQNVKPTVIPGSDNMIFLSFIMVTMSD